MSEHPIHPATVHYPFAFLSLSYALDTAYGLATHASTSKTILSIYNLAPHLGDLARFSHYVNILGILSAVPAAVTGSQQLLLMIQNQDLVSKLEKSQNKGATVQKMHPKMKLAFVHAAMMDLSIVGSVFNWWTRRSTAEHAPKEINLYVSAALLAVIFVSAHLGGSMVYDHGVGVVKKSGAEAKRSKDQ